MKTIDTKELLLAVKAVTLDTGKFALYLGGERIEVEITSRPDLAHVWDRVKINGSSAGNRCGGVRFLRVLAGIDESEEFADRDANRLRADLFEAA